MHAEEKIMLPQYPRTNHIPWKPNMADDDYAADQKECNVLFTSEFVCIEEKVDGSSCGMTYADNEPIIRNRTHILRKGFVKDTPAKKQFTSSWNWFYDNIHLFKKLKEVGPLSVYGDWCFAQHGLEYDSLPSWFVTYDLYNYEVGKYMDSRKSKVILKDIGFTVVPEVHNGPIDCWEQLEELANLPSKFTTLGHQEGIYVKVSDGEWITHRFKMIREGFVQGALWNKKKLNKNTLVRVAND